jgi:hypothetical protein
LLNKTSEALQIRQKQATMREYLKSLHSASSMKLKSCGLASFAVAGMVYTSLGLVSKAEAFTFTSTSSFTNRPTELTGTPLLTLKKFDDALVDSGFTLGPNDALTKVQIDFSGSLTSSGSIQNISANPIDLDFSATGRLRLTKTAGAPSPINTIFNPIPSLTNIGSQEYVGLLPNAPAAYGPFTFTGTSPTQTISAIAQLAEFLGAGNFSFAPTTQIGFTSSAGGGNLIAILSTTADVTATVTYTVEVVPFEFSPVLGVGLLGGLYGLNQLRKNRNKKVNSVK